jgi:hypothetical protein
MITLSGFCWFTISLLLSANQDFNRISKNPLAIIGQIGNGNDWMCTIGMLVLFGTNLLNDDQ